MPSLTEQLREALSSLPTRPAPPPADDTEQYEHLETYIEMTRGRLVGITTRLAVGELTSDEWRYLFEMELRYLHLMAAVFGAGGFEGLSRDMVSLMESALRDQGAYLNNWYLAITPNLIIQQGVGVSDDGLYTPTQAQLEARAALYAEAARATYFRIRARGLGLPPMPFLPGIGTQCHTNCKCRWDFVKLSEQGDWDCYWRRAPVDSCETCLTREAVASPLRVRQGIILPYDATGTMV